MSFGSPDAMKIRCSVKLQFRRCSNGARNWSFALHFQKNTSMQYERTVQKLKHRLRTHWGKALDQVIIFGSVARDAARSTSDIDVMVILDDSTLDVTWKTLSEVRTVVYPLELEDDVIFDLKVMGKHALQGIAGHTPFVETVLREGIRI
ncbi:predicted nucleotidyltransferase [Candidatus Vecturithrix granuli]|uniref:Predicted nucleotidyltransferase n=1 Tax=Vecturithrix granuli TaxID=1499967 RepID=A0A081BVY7_VECG1|nr:predicted nucleotidyltransferase [Candidatus Vecturithrix granuli]